MASHKLPNYIRYHRKRLGLSQGDVDFLLGWNGSAQTSRYEHFCRIPTLRTALALSHIFQVSIHELFSGEKEEMEEAVSKRAQILEELQHKSSSRAAVRKLDFLKSIIIPKAGRL
jgi:hypothetical protein